MQYEKMSDVAVEDMDYINEFGDGAGAYHDAEEVVLTLGSGGMDEINGGSGKVRQSTTTRTSPGHRRRRSSFLVSHGVSSFWYGVCSVVVLVVVLTNPVPSSLITQVAQLLLGNSKLLLPPHLQLQLRSSFSFKSHHFFQPSPPFYSPSAQIFQEPVCENPAPFPTTPPFSKPLTMALEADTKRVVDQFEVTDAYLNSAVKEFLNQMHEGLEKDGTSLSQIPTYVTGVPNGTEKGLYLAVDLGGTNFRVCSVQLNGDTTFNLTYSKVAIPKNLMTADTAEQLFSFLAKQIELFLREHHADHFEQHIRRRATYSAPEGFRDEHVFRLGFTFSFPVQQLGINKGNLIRWTKGFDIPDAVGKDVCALLQTEIDKLHLPVKVAALVNDTVGTLMARSYTSTGKSGSILGAIFGTGTNGAYLEKLSNIKKPIVGDYEAATGEMVVNVEWGSFDNQLNILPKTDADVALDKDSVNPGIQMFEKRVSGMFLGEIVRLTVLDMLKDEKSSLFKDVNSSSNDWKSTTDISRDSGMFKQWGLDSAIMSVAAADNTPELSTLRQELESSLLVYTPSLEDAQAFKAISGAVGRRAARLSAVAIASIVLQSGKLDDPLEEVIDIGVDGSLVEHYPFFRDMIYEALRAIDGIGAEGANKIRIGIAKDGSGVGAALIALVAAGMEKESDVLTEFRKNVQRELDSIPTPRECPTGSITDRIATTVSPV
ncbi:hexokinase [Colletotrichum karsti]|uniref:glucokinase n=1 Tax=Colletotrichum karsti TaxID=1095194 RepID=A0A9P6LJX2_9PEZI|nr:hexokinase [Colletotrichum karsti]KAF9875027.1 hexokinase [Colletotrichum karsti]